MEKVLDIFVTTEKDYSLGVVSGIWISLPTSSEEIEKTLALVSRGQQVVISDYDFVKPEQSFILSPFQSIQELNELLLDYSEDTLLVCTLLQLHNDFEYVKNVLENDAYRYYLDVVNLEELALIMIEEGEIDGLTTAITEELKPFLDPLTIAEHLESNIGWKHSYKTNVAILVFR